GDERGGDILFLEIDLGDRSVRVIATYVEIYANGAQCARTITRTVREKRRIFLRSRCSNPPTVRPQTVILACGDANFQLRRMRWRGWHHRSVRGRGFIYENDCVPFCAAGHFHYHPARVRLYRPRRCSDIGRYIYTRLAWQHLRPPPGYRHRGVEPFSCAMFD